MPRFPLDSGLIVMAKEVSLCYTDRNYPLKFSEDYFEKALQETRNEHPGRNLIFWDACRTEARKKVKADLRRERARRKKKQEEEAHVLPPQPKKRRLKPSADTISGSFF